MKILFVSDYFQPYGVGGANISTLLIAKKLAENNDCFVITQKFQKDPWIYEGLKAYPLLPKYFPDKNIADIIIMEIKSLFAFTDIWSFHRTINNFCKLNNIEVINVQSNNLNLLSALLLINIPLVIDIRDYYLTCPFMLKTEKCDQFHLFCNPTYSTTRNSKLANVLGRILFRYQALTYFIKKNLIFKPILKFKSRKCVFVPNSEYVKNTIVKEFNSHSIKTQVIRNAINENNDRKKTLKNKMVLYAGSLEKSKGVWDCVQAFELINDESYLALAGDGPEMASIQQYIKDKKIKNIKLLGKLKYKDIPKIHQQAYITLNPSVWPEPFGRYILESLASGTPLITTATGGTPETIKDRETGLIVPPNNPQALAKAIIELTTNKKLYNHIKKNIAVESKKYHPELIAQQRQFLYQSLKPKSW